MYCGKLVIKMALICHLEGQFCWINFFQALQHMTISFKEGNTLYHLVHVTFFKSYLIV